ncbi:MAG: response regulator transcription factor [Anaerolineales bacterium]|nr:response regulator transcription factor [Anaerolineales bacterium]
MVRAKILWIEGKRAKGPYFIPNLRKKGFAVETVASGKAALAYLPEMHADLIIVNAASMRSSGKRICQSLYEEANGLPILLISNPDQSSSKDICANEILDLPFTIRKLINRILPLLPGEGDDLYKAGPIFLDMERKLVKCQGKEARLTPRMAQLLKMLMKKPGEVIEREYLFSVVWKTDYTEDTRTLDVHMSWLRQAIEEDPRKPRYIKTIRGLGYRLDI